MLTQVDFSPRVGLPVPGLSLFQTHFFCVSSQSKSEVFLFRRNRGAGPSSVRAPVDRQTRDSSVIGLSVSQSVSQQSSACLALPEGSRAVEIDPVWSHCFLTASRPASQSSVSCQASLPASQSRCQSPVRQRKSRCRSPDEPSAPSQPVQQCLPAVGCLPPYSRCQLQAVRPAVELFRQLSSCQGQRSSRGYSRQSQLPPTAPLPSHSHTRCPTAFRIVESFSMAPVGSVCEPVSQSVPGHLPSPSCSVKLPLDRYRRVLSPSPGVIEVSQSLGSQSVSHEFAPSPSHSHTLVALRPFSIAKLPGQSVTKE
ncbi:hypothetical protein QBC47DRAFT_34584 [Echria macrotheca]|uniref:Uncharacterized protein n=1 Tax=Echria macrotheca TaxID=438768 RepID=A0AAJ0B9C2_9PEZI|nr:hypothetical protein QBC47DRAFT_34584 [Echria macrotheca]